MKRYFPLYRMPLVAMGVALLAGVILFQGRAWSDLSAAVVSTGIDTTRANFIAALLLAWTSALLGAFVSRSRSGAIVGAGMIFGLCYLARFVHTAFQPAYDPAGNLKSLNDIALLSRVLTMTALALLCAFIGAAVGRALADVVLGPPVRLFRRRWQYKPIAENHRSSAMHRLHLIGEWLKAITMLVLIVFAMGSGDLFLYSPDVGLYTGSAKAQGTIKTDHFLSQLSRQTRSFLLYLPPSYFLDRAQTKRYPVLYLLHGSPGGPQDWLTAGQAKISVDTLVARGSIPELILFLPDGNGRPGWTSEWADSFDQTQRIEMYVSSELVSYVDQHYRTLADAQHRAIGGLSMGGFGAMNIAIHHPDTFHSVLSFGGYYSAKGAAWGKNAAYQQANSPLITIRQKQEAHTLHIYLGAASEDQPYATYTRQFARTLDELHIAYHFDLLPGHHAWSVWQSQLYHALRWLQWNA